MPNTDPYPPVPSPCISVCKMDADSGVCVGCFRNLDEIAEWSAASNQRRQSIMVAVEHRRVVLEPRFAPLRSEALK